MWKFKFDSSLVTANGSNVSVTGTFLANAGIYWTTVSAATLNGDTFAGNVMAGSGISSDGGLVISCGRLLADNGPVALIHDTIPIGCGVAGDTGFGSGGFDQANAITNGRAVPEPATLLLFSFGLAGLFASRKSSLPSRDGLRRTDVSARRGYGTVAGTPWRYCTSDSRRLISCLTTA